MRETEDYSLLGYNLDKTKKNIIDIGLINIAQHNIKKDDYCKLPLISDNLIQNTFKIIPYLSSLKSLNNAKKIIQNDINHNYDSDTSIQLPNEEESELDSYSSSDSNSNSDSDSDSDSSSEKFNTNTTILRKLKIKNPNSYHTKFTEKYQESENNLNNLNDKITRQLTQNRQKVQNYCSMMFDAKLQKDKISLIESIKNYNKKSGTVSKSDKEYNSMSLYKLQEIHKNAKERLDASADRFILENTLVVVPNIISRGLDGKKILGMKKPINSKKISKISKNIMVQPTVEQIIDETASGMNMLKKLGPWGRLLTTLAFSFISESYKDDDSDEEDELDE